MSCPWCSGACEGADLTPLLADELRWVWDAVAAAADRRGDEHMRAGTVTVTVPARAAERAAAAGLLGDRPLSAGVRRRVELADLTRRLAARGPSLTPGAVAAHAMSRRLAVRARQREAKDAATAELTQRLEDGLSTVPRHLSLDAAATVSRLARAGWLARLRAQNDPAALVTAALAVVAQLPEPGRRVDRRVLVPGAPHALDGGLLPSLVLALVGASSRRPRDAWAAVGVDIDDLVGGLIVTGVVPAGWSVPAGVTLTVPPRELADIRWAGPPEAGAWVFVTENPSVLSAAVAAYRDGAPPAGLPPRVVCTVGTPSQVECAAVGALAAAEWRVAVRADFDEAGLAHMRALLKAVDVVGTALPWRMSAADYEQVAAENEGGMWVPADASPWDPALAAAMGRRGVPGYEEDLLPALVNDVLHGSPRAHDEPPDV